MNDIVKDTNNTLRERAIAESSLVDYQVYLALGEREKNPLYQELFTELAQVAKENFSFWGRRANYRGDEASRPIVVFMLIFLRRLIGAKQTARYIVSREKAKISRYEVYCVDCLDADEKKAITAMITRSFAVIARLDENNARL